jgi:hypothetical protein
MIRNLEARDVPELVTMLYEFHDAFEYPGKLPINDETAHESFEQYVNHAILSCLVVEENNRLIATMGYMIIRHPWHGEYIFHKGFWYSRKPGAGAKLLRHIINMCKERNITQIHIGSMHPSVDKLLIRNGFRPSETNYLLEL